MRLQWKYEQKLSEKKQKKNAAADVHRFPQIKPNIRVIRWWKTHKSGFAVIQGMCFHEHLLFTIDALSSQIWQVGPERNLKCSLPHPNLSPVCLTNWCLLSLLKSDFICRLFHREHKSTPGYSLLYLATLFTYCKHNTNSSAVAEPQGYPYELP